MKLHFHPVSTASRPVVMFMADAKISYEPVVIDLMTGAHMKDPFISLNPSGMVPALEDDGFVLTESSAILKYLAEKIDSPMYPKDLKKRARINERMDWVNTQLYREFNYHLVYPQVFPNHKRQDEATQKATLSWGKEKAEYWLGILDSKVIGNNKYIAGDEISIADYFASQILHTGELVGCNLQKWSNVNRWMNTMKALPSWKPTCEAVDGFAASMRGKEFVAVA